ncbi:MAG: hypothetical protein ACTTH8_04775 [Treponema sp.]
MKKNDFISSIGYDGAAAVVDKVRRTQNSNKTIEQLLAAGAFRSAAALALYNDSQEELTAVADYYNTLAHSHYTAENITRVFGISKAESKKTIVL